MPNMDIRYILIGLFYVIVGMLFGLYMAYAGRYDYGAIHAHLVLIAGFLFILYGILLNIAPAAKHDPLATTQFWCANVGALLFPVGITIAVFRVTDWVGHAGAALVIVSQLMFVVLYRRAWRATPANG